MFEDWCFTVLCVTWARCLNKETRGGTPSLSSWSGKCCKTMNQLKLLKLVHFVDHVTFERHLMLTKQLNFKMLWPVWVKFDFCPHKSHEGLTMLWFLSKLDPHTQYQIQRMPCTDFCQLQVTLFGHVILNQSKKIESVHEEVLVSYLKFFGAVVGGAPLFCCELSPLVTHSLRLRMKGPMLLLLLLFTVWLNARSGFALSASCSYPPSKWCSSVESAVECGVRKITSGSVILRDREGYCLLNATVHLRSK